MSENENVTLSFVSSETGEEIASFEITQEEYERIEEIAKHDGVSTEECIIRALEQELLKAKEGGNEEQKD